MYLLYADESGTTQDPSQQYFVLAGLCVFERQGFWVSSELDKIAARFNPADPASVELHGSPMLAGRGCGAATRSSRGNRPWRTS